MICVVNQLRDRKAFHFWPGLTNPVSPDLITKLRLTSERLIAKSYESIQLMIQAAFPVSESIQLMTEVFFPGMDSIQLGF